MSKSNESAFPVAPFTMPGGDFNWGESGMTKRELMASMILAGMHGEGFISNCDMAESACNRTDALLKELEK